MLSPRLTQIHNVRGIASPRSFVCLSCRRQIAYAPDTSSLGKQWPRPRGASSIGPVSVVNAAKDISPKAQRLHRALEVLQKDAETYTSLSQLQLALRGLESGNAVTRIALLGLEGLTGVQILARVLLADPLSLETPWEQWLRSLEDTDERALLLRYGDNFDYDQKHPLLRTLTVPARTLRTYNLELLLQATSPVNEASTKSLHGYLVRGLDIPSSSGSRYSVIRYPVHKAMVYGDGLQDLATFAAIDAANGQEEHMVRGSFNTSWNNLRAVGNSRVFPVNVELADTATQTLRKSLDSSIDYEHAWYDSGLPAVSAWLLEGTDPTLDTVKPTVQRLVASLLAATESRIVSEETERLQQLTSAAIPATTRSSLIKRLSAWSENAHTELRDQLDLAFDSPTWRKLAWWKLLWRVDDVAMLTSGILQQSWLTSAEKELIWLVGRIEQAGLYEPPQSSPVASEHIQADVGEPLQVQHAAVFSASVPAPSIENIAPITALLHSNTSLATTPRPYPQTLTEARHALSSATTISLQGIAQRLLLHSLSTTFLTSSLSVLMYISISTTSVYESGAIAVLGLAYSMRRLQNRWDEVRVSWKEGVREHGRIALRAIENYWRIVVSEGGNPKTDTSDMEERSRAREAISRVKSELNAAGKTKP